ncbi:MAG: transcriptional regulator, AraC family [Paenibacillus sp.]|nr:transcriptional regulator, AraC family [Paenibacillus sp.]
MKKTVLIRLMQQLCIAVVLITLIIGSLVYGYVNRMLKQEVYASNAEVLGQTKKIVELALGEVQKMAFSLALNRNVQRAVWLKWNMNEEYQFLEGINELFRDKVTSSNYIHSIYLYSNTNEKIVSNSGISDFSGFWYESAIEAFLQDKATSLWYDTQSIVYADGSTDNVLSYMMSVPLNNYNKSGVLVVNVKEDLLYGAVVNTNNRKLGNVAILNRSGDMLSYKDKSLLYTHFEADAKQMGDHGNGYFIQDLNGTSTFVSYVISEENGWKYVAFNPSREVFKKSTAVLKATLTVSGLCLIIGLLLMVLVSGRYYRPIRSMVQAIDQRLEPGMNSAGYKDEFSYIRGSLDKLWEENEEFQMKFRENEIILRDHFLLHLLLGKPPADDEIARQIEYYGLSLHPERLCVMVLRIDAPEDTDRSQEPFRSILPYQVRTICEEAIVEIGGGAFINQVQKHDVVLMNFEQGVTKEIAGQLAKNAAMRIRNAFEEQTGIKMSVGIGGYYEKASEISLSYEEALEALLLERIGGTGSIVSIQDLMLNHVNRNLFIAYRAQADKLVNELKSGNLDKAQHIKNEIMDQLSRDDQLGYHYKNMILTHIINSIVSIILEWNGQIEDVFGNHYNMYHEYGKQSTLPRISEWFDAILVKTYTFIQSKRDNKNADMMLKVSAYIREHASEPLTLQSVADTLYMNANYFSKLFKDSTGKTFIEYVTEVRMDQACRLLRETDKTIIGIASLSGFGQKLNLIRAFKKTFGITPTEYRNQNIIERLENGSDSENATDPNK